MRVSALAHLRVTRLGMGWPMHAGPVSAAPRVHGAVVQGSVVVVGDGAARVGVVELLVVGLDRNVVVVDDEGVNVVGAVVVLMIVVFGTVASRRTSPPPSAT